MKRQPSLLRDQNGSALTEFAIILALIILSAAAAVLLVGSESEKTFSVLAQWTGTEESSTGRARQRVRRDTADADALEEETEDDPGIVHHIRVDHKTLTVMFSAVALVGYLYSRGKRLATRRQHQQVDEDRELIAAIDTKRFAKRQEILKLLAADPKALWEDRLEVRHLMTTKVRTVRPRTRADEMKTLMEQDHVRHFPVVTDKGVLVGIVSDRDLIGETSRKAAHIMTRNLVTVAPSTKVSPAVTQMINRGISCLPVIEDGRLAGLLTTTDLVMTLQCALQLFQRKNAAGNGQAAPCNGPTALVNV